MSKWVSRFPQMNLEKKIKAYFSFFFYFGISYMLCYLLRRNVALVYPNFLFSKESKIVKRNETIIRVLCSGPEHCPVSLEPERCLRGIIYYPRNCNWCISYMLLYMYVYTSICVVFQLSCTLSTSNEKERHILALNILANIVLTILKC